MKKIVYISFLLILFLSCTSRTIYKKPKNLIGKEKMITVWTDIYIAAGARSVKTKTLRNKINYIPLVLELHNIDSIQFSESNIYYTSRIDEYEKMFEEVQNRLKDKKNRYDPQVKKDSLRQLKQLKQDSLKKLKQLKVDSIRLKSPIDSLKKEKLIHKQRLLEKTKY